MYLGYGGPPTLTREQYWCGRALILNYGRKKVHGAMDLSTYLDTTNYDGTISYFINRYRYSIITLDSLL